MQIFDVVVIGTGPGGYVSAIRAAQLGEKVAIVEKHKVGGIYLNVGCISSKTYLQYSDTVRKIRQANDWGIETNEPHINFDKLRERKDKIVKTLTGGVQHLLKNNGITVFEGEAAVDKNNTVTIGEEKIEAKDVILATGSTPFIPPISELEQVDYETTDTLFEMTKLQTSEREPITSTRNEASS
ncbi:NAD(P)/FAD-dependent oxidoreductase [Salicibibacter cibi]|uniref:NAD(P)/FAD-dependent oxidoreductase n=1 Tax=Salicibibacter cibi TaxID=2743001 RepID=A0A7T6ZBD4_9BACI|nr:FAD-dependent oxidoreductase [Salicibibacter cibi]QQK80386.1 NAD(P)/FAD-dependent oxidoreductase [Salicibibacter cibi]